MNKRKRTPLAAIMLIVISVLEVIQFTDSVPNILGVASLGIGIAICTTLFAKKYNNLLVILLGCKTLLNIISLVGLFNIYNLLFFVAYAFLTLFALSVCEQTLIKADLSKIKEFTSKLFYLPAVVCLVRLLYMIIITISDFEGFVHVLELVIALFDVIALLSLGMWLKDPYSEEKAVVAAGENSGLPEAGEGEEAYCSLGKHILLLLFTVGIWQLIWIYRTTKYLNKTPNAEFYNPASKLLLFLFVPFYSIYWFYKHGQRIDSFTKSKGLNNSDMATLCLILGIFIPIVACIIMQDKINALCTVKAANQANREGSHVADELKKFRELLDSGIITQEEFDAKKKELLGL